jgi:predicted N-acetyltransferase YhbS
LRVDQQLGAGLTMPASRGDIRPPFEVPDDVFMALELIKDGLKNTRGTVVYPAEFDDIG